jgi:hypothetical protein
VFYRRAVAILATVCLAGGCSGQGAGWPEPAAAGAAEEADQPEPAAAEVSQPPAPFEVKLRSIRVGMTRPEVRRALGDPDDIQTPDDHAGTWTLGTSETWGYGAERHRACPSRGAVYFDRAGRVQYVYGPGGRLQPPR